MNDGALEQEDFIRPLVLALVALAIALLYLHLADDGRHHWHEFRYLYSAANYSTVELMHGAFDPGPAPMHSVRQVAEWYATELLHIELLRGLIASLGDGLDAYRKIKSIFAGAMIISAFFFYAALSRIGIARFRSLSIVCLALFNPVSLYLGFKIMGEVPGLLFGSAALALFAFSVSRPGQTILLALLSGFVLGAAALASAKMPLLLIGFAAALLAAPPEGLPRSRIARASGIGLSAWVLFWAAGFELLGGEPSIYLSAFRSFLSFTKDLPMLSFAIFSLMLAGGFFWLVGPLAWLSRDRPLARFFVTWLAVSAIPVLLGGLNFLEPRYFVVAIVPASGLAFLGLEWGLRCLTEARSHLIARLATGAVVLLAVSSSVFVQRFMPYDTDEANLLAAVEPRFAVGDIAVLVPWNYTDFHFLRFAFPNEPVYLVQSAADEKGNRVEDPAWSARRSEMYGAHYLANAGDLSRIRESKLVYVGWTILPSLQNLGEFLQRLGLHRFAARLDPANFFNHLEQSWLWQNPDFALTPLETHGQYRVYAVGRAAAGAQRVHFYSDASLPFGQMVLGRLATRTEVKQKQVFP